MTYTGTNDLVEDVDECCLSLDFFRCCFIRSRIQYTNGTGVAVSSWIGE